MHHGKRLLELNPKNAMGFVLWSDMYAAAGKWDLSAIFGKKEWKKDVNQQLRCTWIDVNSEVNELICHGNLTDENSIVTCSGCQNCAVLWAMSWRCAISLVVLSMNCLDFEVYSVNLLKIWKLHSLGSQKSLKFCAQQSSQSGSCIVQLVAHILCLCNLGLKYQSSLARFDFTARLV